MKRSRRGGRRPQPGGHNGHNVGNGGGGHNPNRTFDSNGPEIKIRGSAANVYEKYLQLARDANASGDRIMAENYLQHAEHYYRIMAVAQAQAQQYAQQNGQNNNPNNPQVRPPNGPGDQPYTQQQPGGAPQTSAPSFSLTEGGQEDGDDEDDDGPE